MYWFHGRGLGDWVLETNSPHIVRPWAQDKLQGGEACRARAAGLLLFLN